MTKEEAKQLKIGDNLATSNDVGKVVAFDSFGIIIQWTSDDQPEGFDFSGMRHIEKLGEG